MSNGWGTSIYTITAPPFFCWGDNFQSQTKRQDQKKINTRGNLKVPTINISLGELYTFAIYLLSIFLPCKQMLVALKILNSTPYFLQWIQKKSILILKLILSDSESLDFLTAASTVWQFYWFQSCTVTCSRFAIAKFAKCNSPFRICFMFNVFVLKRKESLVCWLFWNKPKCNGLVVKVLDSPSRGPIFKTTERLQGRLSLSSF